MADITSNIEWDDNIYVHKFVKETRVGGEVRQLTIKLKVYKKDAIPTIPGDNSILTYTDHSMTKYIKTGTNYLDFNNATPLVEKSFIYVIPEADRTSGTQTHATKSLRKEYFTKSKAWSASYQVLSDYEVCYNALWTDLEALDVSW